MGYRQHNNPFSKSISPLQHNVRSATGEEWKHTHNLGRVSGRVDRGRLISGDADFNKRTNRAVRDERTGTKRLPDGSRATSENYAREYARQLADYYNKGYITGGQFLAQEFDKKKGKLNFFKKGKLVDYKGGRKSINLPGMYNLTASEVENIVVPETQYTEDDIYEMMVQGNGLVSIVDGKIVAGNPNQVRDENDMVRERVSNRNEYTLDERSRRIYDDNWVPEGYEMYTPESQPKKKTVAELLEERKQRNNPISMMKNSPLNTGHGLDTDERSDNEQEGYDYVYRPDDAVTTTERVELDDGGYKIITRVVTPGTGTQIIEEPGGGGRIPSDGGGEGFTNPALPNQTWQEFIDAPCPSPGKPEGHRYCPPKTDDVEIVNVSEEIFPPEDPDPDPEPEPELVDINFDLGQGSIKRDDFSIDLPEINLPDLGLDQLRILQKKCGGCKQRGLIQRAILALGGGI
jgi:hypothetical protein